MLEIIFLKYTSCNYPFCLLKRLSCDSNSFHFMSFKHINDLITMLYLICMFPILADKSVKMTDIVTVLVVVKE